ncbi:hypothetical protein NXW62_22200 [Bacteroides fragilis]|nr:hypothetical protein [Bacteroides fragilis]
MFVATWYKNNQLSQQFTNNAKAYFDSQDPFSDYWYRFLFIDGSNATCQNEKMKKELLEEHTYYRWQQWSSLYGISKYSLVYLTNNEVPDYLIEYFQTIYARMAELVLVQRASMLRFSGEITKVSQLSNQDVEAVSKRVSSLYKEYIRFVNQIYFREITAQDQGIEMYNKLHSCLQMESYIKDLDGEIEELHQYISLMEDRERNKKASLLNDIATLFLPITVITGFWGMNQISEVMEENGELSTGFIIQSLLLIIGTLCAICIIYKKKKKTMNWKLVECEIALIVSLTVIECVNMGQNSPKDITCLTVFFCIMIVLLPLIGVLQQWHLSCFQNRQKEKEYQAKQETDEKMKTWLLAREAIIKDKEKEELTNKVNGLQQKCDSLIENQENELKKFYLSILSIIGTKDDLKSIEENFKKDEGFL